MRSSNVEERYKRIESYIDTVYDLTYSAVDAVFIGVDYVYQHAKKRAQTRAQRVCVAPVVDSDGDLTLADKVECLIKFCDDNGQNKIAQLMRRQLKAGMYDVDTVERKFSSLPEEYKNATRR